MQPTISDIETTLDAYIQAALWSSNDVSDESGGEPFNQNYSVDDIAPETLETMRRDVAAFLARAIALVDTWDGGRTTPAEQAGHDFWLTRNGHGCGFWESEWGSVGAELTTIAESFGTFDLYLGDDDLIHGC